MDLEQLSAFSRTDKYVLGQQNKKDHKEEKKKQAARERLQRRTENNLKYFDPQTIPKLVSRIGETKMIHTVKIIYSALKMVRTSGIYFKVKTRWFFTCLIRTQRTVRQFLRQRKKKFQELHDLWNARERALFQTRRAALRRMVLDGIMMRRSAHLTLKDLWTDYVPCMIPKLLKQRVVGEYYMAVRKFHTLEYRRWRARQLELTEKLDQEKRDCRLLDKAQELGVDFPGFTTKAVGIMRDFIVVTAEKMPVQPVFSITFDARALYERAMSYDRDTWVDCIRPHCGDFFVLLNRMFRGVPNEYWEDAVAELKVSVASQLTSDTVEQIEENTAQAELEEEDEEAVEEGSPASTAITHSTRGIQGLKTEKSKAAADSQVIISFEELESGSIRVTSNRNNTPSPLPHGSIPMEDDDGNVTLFPPTASYDGFSLEDQQQVNSPIPWRRHNRPQSARTVPSSGNSQMLSASYGRPSSARARICRSYVKDEDDAAPTIEFHPYLEKSVEHGPLSHRMRMPGTDHNYLPARSTKAHRMLYNNGQQQKGNADKHDKEDDLIHQLQFQPTRTLRAMQTPFTPVVRYPSLVPRSSSPTIVLSKDEDQRDDPSSTPTSPLVASLLAAPPPVRKYRMPTNQYTGNVDGSKSTSYLSPTFSSRQHRTRISMIHQHEAERLAAAAAGRTLPEEEATATVHMNHKASNINNRSPTGSATRSSLAINEKTVHLSMAANRKVAIKRSGGKRNSRSDSMAALWGSPSFGSMSSSNLDLSSDVFHNLTGQHMHGLYGNAATGEALKDLSEQESLTKAEGVEKFLHVHTPIQTATAQSTQFESKFATLYNDLLNLMDSTDP